MTTQQQSRLYWKDALRQAQIEIEATEDAETTELSPVHNRKWTKAYHQAQADLKDPSAVVWLPDEIADVIRQAHPTPEPSSPAQSRRQRLKALLLALLFLVPAAISYLLAYRRIAAHLR